MLASLFQEIWNFCFHAYLSTLETHELFRNISDATTILHWHFRNCFHGDEQTFTLAEAHDKEQIVIHPFYYEETITHYYLPFTHLAFQASLISNDQAKLFPHV